MLRIILLLIIVAGVAGYFTNPKEEAYVEPARAAIGDVGGEQMSEGTLSGVVEGVTNSARSAVGGGEYTNYVVASSYSMPNTENPTVTCYGAFTKVWTCQRVEAAATGGESSGG